MLKNKRRYLSEIEVCKIFTEVITKFKTGVSPFSANLYDVTVR